MVRIFFLEVLGSIRDVTSLGLLWDCEILILHMDVSENSGTPKSSILKGFSIINHAFWGTTILGNTYIMSIIQQVDGMITFLLNILSIADQNHGMGVVCF